DLAKDVNLFHRTGEDAIDDFRAQGLAALQVDFTGFRVYDVPHGDGPFQLGPVRGHNLHFLGRVEGLENVRVGGIGGVHGAEQRHGGELARLVDADPQRVLLGDVDFNPAATLGDDAAGVQFLVTGFRLDDEVHTRRAVQLADDDAFGAVDDELA